MQARIGATIWNTSIFFSDGAFVLPLKKAVRDSCGIAEGEAITVDLDILDL